jgi:uncharacterized protein
LGSHLSPCGIRHVRVATLGNIIGALIAWVVFKDRSAFADDQGKEALNFQISTTIYAFAIGAFAVVTLGIGLLLAIPLWGALAIFHVIVMVIAALEANKGVAYRYPLTIRFIK